MSEKFLEYGHMFIDFVGTSTIAWYLCKWFLSLIISIIEKIKKRNKGSNI